jgi:hypothetical protein
MPDYTSSDPARRPDGAGCAGPYYHYAGSANPGPSPSLGA